MKKILIIIAAVSLLAIAGIASLLFYLIKNCESRDILPQEKKLLFTASLLQEMGVQEIYPETCEKFKVTMIRNKQGTAYQYEYRFSKDKRSRVLNIKSETIFAETKNDARISYESYKAGLRLNFRKDKVTMKNIQWTISGADKSENFFLLDSNDKQIGNTVLIHKNKAFIAISIAGNYFSNKEQFMNLIYPTIDEVTRFQQVEYE